MRLTLPILVLGLILALASPASAYVLAGDAWPGRSINYYVRNGGDPRVVDRAARAWNRANIGIRLRRVTGGGADVLVGFQSDSPCSGWATIGRSWSLGRVTLGTGCGRSRALLMAAHEFGHVLGLGHERRRCSLMNPALDRATGTPSRCSRRRLSFWVNRPLRRDDIHGARALYRAR